mmetsp:Transcript_3074/g.7958  ORF Transcript_3074/g.7958 Transcript_3074/m.7958 type:complete len:251 (+) Transcript_3074:185-937(+)
MPLEPFSSITLRSSLPAEPLSTRTPQSALCLIWFFSTRGDAPSTSLRPAPSLWWTSFSSSTSERAARISTPARLDCATSLLRSCAVHSPSTTMPWPSCSLIVLPLIRALHPGRSCTPKPSLAVIVFAFRSLCASFSRMIPPPALSRIVLLAMRPLPPCLTWMPHSPHSLIVLPVTSGSDPLSTVIAAPLCSLRKFSLTKPRAYSHSNTPPPPPLIVFCRRVTCVAPDSSVSMPEIVTPSVGSATSKPIDA